MNHDVKRGLPNRYYDNRDDFLVERERIFSPMWVCIGFASDLSHPGDAFPLEFMELPLLLVRDRDHRVRVFHNVCRHRGHLLVAEPGQMGRSISCPYHAWTYALDGSLIRTPNIGGAGVHQVDGFDVTGMGLVQVRSAVWHDLVFINLDGSAGPFDEFIAPLEKRWSKLWGKTGADYLRVPDDYGSITFDLETNWKLVVENYLEAYHLPTVHPELNRVSPLQDHEIQVSEQFAGQVSHCYEVGAGSQDHLPIFPDWSSELLQEADYPALFPNTLLGLQADHLFVMAVIPLEYGRTREKVRLYCVGDESLTERYQTLRQDQHAFWTRVFQEDVSAVMGMQKGRASSGFDGGVLSPLMDRGTAAFHEWAGARLGV